jgi:hypothetical protein
MEPAAIDELQSGWGISMNITGGAFPTSTGPTGDFFNDLVDIFRALHAVTSNTNTTVGGGGAPLAPLAPPICDA